MTGAVERHSGAARLVLLTAALSATTLLLLPLLAATRYLGGRASGLAPCLWHRAARRLIGLRVQVRGAPISGRPLLLVANHTSWLDIVTIGSVMPVSFVAKSEVAGWPVFGWLAAMQRTVYVDRNRRADARASASRISGRLEHGEVLVLFAEGTTGDGTRILPFRSALIGAAETALGGTGVVQPLAISYVRRYGIPLGRQGRQRLSWTGDSELLPSLRDILIGGPLDAAVVFGPPLAASAGRKWIARSAQADVARCVALLNAGRQLDSATERDDRHEEHR